MDKPRDNLFTTVSEQLKRLARGNAVVATPVSLEHRHIVPLCELSMAIGAGGGIDETENGTGGGAGGAAKANPVAVLVVENGRARLENLD